MGWRLVFMPTRMFENERLVLVVFVTAIDSMESRSCSLAADSRASSSVMSVSSGLYFGRVSSLVTE